MGFCARNLSLGVFGRSYQDFLEILPNTTIIGVVGRLYDQFLVHKNRRWEKVKPSWWIRVSNSEIILNNKICFFPSLYLKELHLPTYLGDEGG